MTGRALFTAILFGSAIAGARPVTHAAMTQTHEPDGREVDKSAPRSCHQTVGAATSPRCPN